MQINTPAKHKIAIVDLVPGDPLIMYGIIVGKAVVNIQSGEVITTNNVRHAAEESKLRYRGLLGLRPDSSDFSKLTFNGYHREDGKVGVDA